ncbi:MAG: Zn-ribbon domain-containing OB-fold protein, partial [Trebonia sp.]
MSEPRRPLPLVTPWTEFYWTSGADGRLRFQECASCSALIHPPKPVCPYCRGAELRVRAVSGLATLFGFTVSHRFALPGLPSPYIVAQVAIEEDPRVRLTTRLVDCEAGELSLGLRMTVTFEHVEDVWLPLFRPAPEQPEQSERPELPPDEVPA